MDFSAFKKKLTDAATPLMQKAAPLVEKAKVAGFKAMDYTQKQLQNTPLVLKTVEEYKDLLTKKRAIIIAYNESDPSTREILMRIPLWSTKAWSDAAELRLVETSSESELSTHLSIQTPVDMRVSYIGEETFHSTDVASILKWWETCCYDGKYEEEPKKDDAKKEAAPAQETKTETEVKEEVPEADPLGKK